MEEWAFRRRLLAALDRIADALEAANAANPILAIQRALGEAEAADGDGQPADPAAEGEAWRFR